MKDDKKFENRIIPTNQKQSFHKQTKNCIDGADISSGTDPHGPIMITGVESEDSLGEEMPSSLLLLVLDYMWSKLDMWWAK